MHQKILEEKGYLPEQVFYADKSALFWNKMPQKTLFTPYEEK